MKIAIILFNLGGPDSLDAVQPFLRNLFSDPAIITLPTKLDQYSSGVDAPGTRRAMPTMAISLSS